MSALPKFLFPATVFSPTRIYRYTLSRETKYFANSPVDKIVQFVGLNPSKADEVRNDNTVSKCIRYATNWGFGGMVMTNIFAYRSTDPEALYKHYVRDDDRLVEENLPWVLAVAERADLIVACWGNHGAYLGRGKHYADALSQRYPKKLATLARDDGGAFKRCGLPPTPRINASGHPTHPCRESGSLIWAPWDGKGVSQ